MLVFEAASQPGGQIRLAAALKRRREIMGIVDWRMAECERHGVAFRFDAFADAADVLAEGADVVVVATGGLPDTDFLDAGADLATSGWDILSGTVRPAASVLLYDDNGAHPGLTAAEFIADAGAALDVVTPERTLAPDVGGTSFPAYVAALNRAGATVSINLRLERLERRGNRVVAHFFDDYGKRHVEREADQVVVEHGTNPLDELYFALKPGSVNGGEVDHAALLGGRAQTVARNPDGRYRLFRIGDAVSSRNIHAAVYDTMRLMKDV